MTEISDRYRRLSGAFAVRLATVRDDQWSQPTPCADWNVRDLVRHVVQSQVRFLGLVGRDPGPMPDVETDARGAWETTRARPCSAASTTPRASAEFDGFFGRSTFEAAVDRFLCSDLVVHGWDLARATGQDSAIDPDDAARTLEGAYAFGDAFRGANVCGPPVVVPDDADAAMRLIAFYGRTP